MTTKKQDPQGNNSKENSNAGLPTITTVPCPAFTSKKKPDSGLSSLRPPATCGLSKHQETNVSDDKSETNGSEKDNQHVSLDMLPSSEQSRGTAADAKVPNLQPMTTSRAARKKCTKKKLLILLVCLILIVGIAIATVGLTVMKDDNSDDDSSENKITFRFTTGKSIHAESIGKFRIQLQNKTTINACSTEIDNVPYSGKSKSYTLICSNGTQTSPMSLTTLTRDSWYIESVSVQDEDTGMFAKMAPEGIWCGPSHDDQPYVIEFTKAVKPTDPPAEPETLRPTEPPTGPETAPPTELPTEPYTPPPTEPLTGRETVPPTEPPRTRNDTSH